MAYIILFLAGAFGCNSLPHLVSGLRGETFFTPWARPFGKGRSSAVENFLWGAANLVVGLLLYRWAASWQVPYELLAVGIGFVVTGIGLSMHFGRRQQKGE